MNCLLRSGCTSRVAPRRLRATTTGICSSERPRLAALPPLTGGPGQTPPATLEGLEDKGLIGFDDPRKALGLVVIERGEKSMSPPEGGARVDLASLGRLRERELSKCETTLRRRQRLHGRKPRFEVRALRGLPLQSSRGHADPRRRNTICDKRHIRCPNILRGNVYGRFVPVERGAYTLAESGRAALLRWPQLAPLTAVHQ